MKIKPISIGLAFIFVLIVSYALFQARFLILGPRIIVETPKDGETVDTEVVIASGVIKNASWISMNGRQIFTDEEGRWSEKLVVSEGVSIITIEARDRFGRERRKEITVFLKDQEEVNNEEEGVNNINQ